MMRLLDLFCCSGIGAEGYARAGFEVVGVDIDAQPNYPFEFHQHDVFDLVGSLRAGLFDAVHASPPCQHASDLQKQNKRLYPHLIEPTRAFLRSTGLPYVIENVEGAALLEPVMLCGTMFPGLRVLRHRLFETNWELIPPGHRSHPLVYTKDKRKAHYGKLDQDVSFVQVTGGGNCTMRNARAAMGLPANDRRTKRELNEGIPPAYTEFVGATVARCRRSTAGRMTQVRVVHASLHRGDVGTVIGPATQAGMDVCVDFGSDDFGEFRWWELVTFRPGEIEARR